MLRRRSAVVLVIGAGAFGMFDPPAEETKAPPGDTTTFTRRYHPPVVSGGGVRLGPATRISKRP